MHRVVPENFRSDIIIEVDDGPVTFQFIEPFLPIVIMFEFFIQERLGQLNSNRLIVDTEKPIFKLNASGHNIEWVGDTHGSLDARIVMMITQIAQEVICT